MISDYFNTIVFLLEHYLAKAKLPCFKEATKVASQVELANTISMELSVLPFALVPRSLMFRMRVFPNPVHWARWSTRIAGSLWERVSVPVRPHLANVVSGEKLAVVFVEPERSLRDDDLP